MSMKERFIKKRRSYLVFFFLTAFAVLSFFPKLTLAASKQTAKQLKQAAADSNMTMIPQSYI